MDRRRTAPAAGLDKRTVKMVAALAVLTLLFLAGLFLLHIWEENAGAVNGPASGGTNPEDALTYYNGAWYRPRKGLETVLAIGVDQAAVDDTLYRPGKYEQSDFLLLLVIDKRNERCTAVHINRDAMTEIRVLDDDTNELLGTINGQLALAHAYGNRPEACCGNTVAAVSGLLYGIEIDHYLSLTMDGVAVLNDLAGGVTLEVMDDLTGLDPALIQGKTVTLEGRQALTYVQSRRTLADPTNIHRMERQRQYLEALQKRLVQRADADEGFAVSALLELNTYMVSDCSVEKLSDLANVLGEYGVTEYRTLKGESVMGETYMEYYVDETAARELVMELFYEPAPNQQARFPDAMEQVLKSAYF